MWGSQRDERCDSWRLHRGNGTRGGCYSFVEVSGGRSGVGLGVFYCTHTLDFAIECFAPVVADVEPRAVDSRAESEVEDLPHLESGEIAAGVDHIKLVSCLQLIHLGFVGAGVDSSIGTAASVDVSVAADVGPSPLFRLKEFRLKERETRGTLCLSVEWVQEMGRP